MDSRPLTDEPVSANSVGKDFLPDSKGSTYPLLEIVGLKVTLARTQVLRGVNMTVRSGEIHALMGGNGAGKSTLIKCLSGYWKPNEGSILINGAPFVPGTGQIAFVQQDLGLIPSLSVLENTCLGRGFSTNAMGKIRWRKESERVAGLLEDLGHSSIDPRALISDLDAVERTVVAIARATQGLREGARLLVLDEPTATLPVDETQRLFETIKRLRDSGIGMIYVSHHLAEVLDLADRISVLRDGELVATSKAAEVTDTQIISMMLGHDVSPLSRPRLHDQTAVGKPEPIVRLEGVVGGRVQGVSLDVKPGEIVGLAGLQGSGCTEVAEFLFGAKRPQRGEMFLRGERVEFSHPCEAVAAGIALVTEDRHLNGSFLDQSVTENISVTDVRRFFRWGWLSARRETAETGELITRFEIQPAESKRRFSTLSGGNQQKAVIAKWIRLNPTLLICDQPDVGVDIGAKWQIYAGIVQLVESGSGAILISNQHGDLEALCDRVVVLRNGRVAAILVGSSLTEQEISRVVVGGTVSDLESKP
jgi:ribose transport system ATP-binding protein